MKKTELKQLIKEQITLMGYVDLGGIGHPISNKPIVKESTISESYIKDQLNSVLAEYDDTDQYDHIQLKVSCNKTSTKFLSINMEQLEQIIKIFS